MAACGWEHFEHGADVGVRGWGTSREQAFEQAALALANVITDAATVEPHERIEITCAAPDDALLLVDWLDALVFETATRGMLFGRFAIRMEDHRLQGAAWGEAIDPARHDVTVEVKGVTHTALQVGVHDGRWLAQCIVDV